MVICANRAVPGLSSLNRPYFLVLRTEHHDGESLQQDPRCGCCANWRDCGGEPPSQSASEPDAGTGSWSSGDTRPRLKRVWAAQSRPPVVPMRDGDCEATSDVTDTLQHRRN